MELEQTCWQGMWIEHPPQWELSQASGADKPGRCIFSDRRYQRLDVQWRPLKYMPNMELMLARHRHNERKDDKFEVADLIGAPEEWAGIVRKTAEGPIVHAGRFFHEARLLTEVTLIWPGGRDRRVENAILSSIRPAPPEGGVQRWRAMGIDMSVAGAYGLSTSNTRVGRVKWEFRPAAKTAQVLSLERIALPQQWLTMPLRDWLVEQLPSGQKAVRQDACVFNNHRGEQLISRGKISTVSSFRGLKRMMLDVAWLCPTEGRVYHLRLIQPSRSEEISMPDHLRVACCRPAPVVKIQWTGQ